MSERISRSPSKWNTHCCVKAQLARFLDFEVATNPAIMVNNADWTRADVVPRISPRRRKTFHDQLDDRKRVRSLADGKRHGISYTEFSYMLPASLIFIICANSADCELQVGATDQWVTLPPVPNCCRKKLARPPGGSFSAAHQSDGTKYGKTAAGAVWLDAKRRVRTAMYSFLCKATTATS